MKTASLLCFVALFTFTNLLVHAQNTVHSKPGGGYYSDPATWVEGYTPTALDSVVIQSSVTIGAYSNLCKSMLITDTGIIGWGSGGGHVVINGSLYNYGLIGTGLYLLYGDIINESLIEGNDVVIKFIGTNHSITCTSGKSIDAQFLADDSLQNITLKSDLEINNAAALLGNSELYTQDYTLKITGGSLQHCRIHAFDTLYFNAVVGNLIISGNYKLGGTLDILGNLNLKDEAVNIGKIRSLYGAASDLNLYGDFINNDTIEGSTAGNLNVNVIKSAINHGFWNSNVTKFIGDTDKHISHSPGHPFGGTQLVTDNSGLTIYFDSDVEFTMPTIFLYSDKISCEEYILTANSTFNQGTIHSESEIQGNSDFWSSQFKGNFRFTGNPRFSNCSTEGNIENTGHMQDITFYGGTFSSKGFLDNKSNITGIHFHIYGNLCNTGNIRDNCIVDVVGNTSQYILFTNAIESQCYFYSDITGVSYQWMKDGQDINNANGVYLFFNSLQLSDAGVYKCRVTDGSGTTSVSREIIVLETTSLEEDLSMDINLTAWPNPFIDQLKLKWEQQSIMKVKIALIDAKGMLVKEIANSVFPSGYNSIDVLKTTNLKPGIYFISMLIEDDLKVIRLVHVN